MHQIYPPLLSRIRSGSSSALATVIRTSGSTPQKPGSSALFDGNGLVTGTVGGGLLEGEIQHACAQALISGVSDHYSFELDSDQGSEGAICGGAATVLVDARPDRHLEAFEAMEKSLASSEGGWLLTSVSNTERTGKIIQREWIRFSQQVDFPGNLPAQMKPLLEKVAVDLRKDEFMEVALPERASSEWEIIYLEPVMPLPRLVIAGAGHVGKAVAHLGRLLDFDVTVIDDRPDLANSHHIPDASHFITGSFPDSMSALKPGPDTYIVIVTRGHQHDADVLISCINTPATYIGMIGSRTKVAHVKRRFLENGWTTPENWARVHTPIGIEIGSKTVQEIAVSIAAQLIGTRNRKKEAHEK